MERLRPHYANGINHSVYSQGLPSLRLPVLELKNQTFQIQLSYLDSQSSGSKTTEASIGVLLTSQPGHRTAHEVNEAAMAMVLHYAA